MDNYKQEHFQAQERYSAREFKEAPHPIRGDFSRDRDRILYSKAFRRLGGKTQVFVAGSDDHIRTRLTHTLEVAQISKTIAEALGLNITLCEAIALGHDIGHTPFGHVGERTLNFIMNGCDVIKDFNLSLPIESRGFKHNWQSIRVVNQLESSSENYNGLNLTNYTIWGLLYHSKISWKKCDKNGHGHCSLGHKLDKKCAYEEAANENKLSVKFYDKYLGLLPDDSWTFEGMVVGIADEIAQRHHDIEDGLEARIIDKNELLQKFEDLFNPFLSDKEKLDIISIKNEADKTFYIPAISKLIVNFLTTSLIINSSNQLCRISEKHSIKTSENFYRQKNEISKDKDFNNIISYTIDLKAKDEAFQKYLSTRILNSYKAQSMDGKATFVIRQLFKAYLTNPQQLPDRTINTLFTNYLSHEDMIKYEKYSPTEKSGHLRQRLNEEHFEINCTPYKAILLRTICDYISGMTDKYALEQYQLLYGIQ